LNKTNPFLTTHSNSELSLVSTITSENLESLVGNAESSNNKITSTFESGEMNDKIVTPTMDKTNQKKFLYNIYQNQDCKFPCWLNIIPGSTLWKDGIHNQILNDYFVTSYNINDSIVHYGYIPSYDSQLGINALILEKETIVRKINFGGAGFWDTPSYVELHDIFKQYFPEQILLTYGQPDNIFLYLYDYRGLDTEYTSYNLWFIYEKSDFYVKYEGLTENTYDIYHICPKQIINDIHITIQSPDQDLQLDKDVFGNDDKEAKYKMPFMEVTDITIEQFYESMVDPENEACFNTNYENWISDEWR